MDLKRRIAKAILPPFALDFLLLTRRHKAAHGRFPHIFRPKSFNEKILWRNLFDRSPLLTQFVDKFAVRSYVESKIGAEALPELYWETKNPLDIPFDKFPKNFVVKPTHGSGWVRLVREKSGFDRDELVQTCQSWLEQNFYEQTRERVYRKIPRRIMVEEFISPESDRVPDDYKFYVFDGRVEMVEFISGRFENLTSALFDRNWNSMDVAFDGFGSPASGTGERPQSIAKPRRFDEMISMAETLGQDIDFVRVDLYHTDKKVFFGELTSSPGAGLDPFEPRSFDEHLGSLWPRPGSRAKRAVR